MIELLHKYQNNYWNEYNKTKHVTKRKKQRILNMKKLMISLATIALISGSVANATACVQKNDTLNKIIQKNSSNLKATNEDAEDIANKL